VSCGESTSQLTFFDTLNCGLRQLQRHEIAVKLVELRPQPKDIEVFEKVHKRDHVPMAVEKLAGKTKFVATTVLGSLRKGRLPSIASRRFISPRWGPWM
jgi:hypothetical protein